MSFAENLLDRRRFTAAEVMRMVDTGVLGEDEHLELLEGELIVVSPQGPKHSTRTVHLRRILERAYGTGWHVRDHSPVTGTVDSIPEPDLAVVRGDPLSFDERLPGPGDVALVVEVAFSSQAIDRRKAQIYGRAGYGCYWLVDLEARRIEVYRSPTADGRYGHTDIIETAATVELPLATGSLAVQELIP